MKGHAVEILDTKPWWKYGYVWYIIAGPALVVVAGFITLYLAITRPDPVIDDDYYQNGININKTLEANTIAERNSLEPANLARNHAATGVNAQP
ncbi:MAG: FixH family protein [Methylotenera sp.]|nr:nitrogen fixation protein FixH [Methylotenera sp.]NOT65492.1 nitrogen fixation protein FixH [Methylotenera sp.]